MNRELKNFGKEVIEATTQRFLEGKQEFSYMSMKEMLSILEINIRENPEALALFQEMVDNPPSSLSHPPASEAEIEDLEEHLGIQLPDYYKEFLYINNGMDASFGFFFRIRGIQTIPR